MLVDDDRPEEYGHLLAEGKAEDSREMLADDRHGHLLAQGKAEDYRQMMAEHEPEVYRHLLADGKAEEGYGHFLVRLLSIHPLQGEEVNVVARA